MREESLTLPETFASKVISFYDSLAFGGILPDGISIMNPFAANPEVKRITSLFYNRFFNDFRERYLILGINPGRFGAGVTGIPFTDSYQLSDRCGISTEGVDTRELSSVYVYEMIEKYGGVSQFYSQFYISAVCPLGFTARSKKGREVNYNYYDSRELTSAVNSFITVSLEKQLEFGIKRDICFCLGTGKNYRFLSDLNLKHKFFGRLIPLDHPRYIMQYRLKEKDRYIRKYIEVLSRADQ